MRIAFLVVFDLPPGQPEPDPAQLDHARTALLDVVRKQTEQNCGVSVHPHPLTPAELAALP